MTQIDLRENGSGENPNVGTESQDQQVIAQVLKSFANFINNQSFLDHSRRIILAAFAGAIGSMMCFLIRLDQIDQEQIRNPFLLETLNPLIGEVFGVAAFAILSTQVIDILPAKFDLRSSESERLSSDSPSSAPLIYHRDPLGALDS